MAQAFGLDVGELPDGWQPVEALVIVKCLIPDDSTSKQFPYRLSLRASDGLSMWEAAGMLRVNAADVDAQFVASLSDG
jgi:hypothetical protein